MSDKTRLMDMLGKIAAEENICFVLGVHDDELGDVFHVSGRGSTELGLATILQAYIEDYALEPPDFNADED